MNKLYGITNDNFIVVIESICHCPECVKRGMYETELNLLDGSYYSMLRLDELKDFLKFVSPNYKTVSNYFKEITLEKIERYRFILMSNWRNVPPTVRHMIQKLIDENKRLEMALDKACEQLESLSYENNMMKASPYAYDCDYTKEEEWKDWCLEDD